MECTSKTTPRFDGDTRVRNTRLGCAFPGDGAASERHAFFPAGLPQPQVTLLIGEVNAQFKPWGHPVNWRDPTAGINSSQHGFGGPPGSGGANFVMADASIRFLSD